jgi:hypothetical protein
MRLILLDRILKKQPNKGKKNIANYIFTEISQQKNITSMTLIIIRMNKRNNKETENKPKQPFRATNPL